jgi:hypothetical protein
LIVVNITKKRHAQEELAQQQEFSSMLEGVSPEFYYFEGDDVTREIGNFLAATHAQGLVAVSHEHSLLHRLCNDSVTRQLAHQVNVPLLVLHDAN